MGPHRCRRPGNCSRSLMRAAAVAGIGMRERADERELVRICAMLQRAADLTPVSLVLTAPVTERDPAAAVRLWIERLDLGRSARQPKPNDRGLLRERTGTNICSRDPEETRKGQGANPMYRRKEIDANCRAARHHAGTRTS